MAGPTQDAARRRAALSRTLKAVRQRRGMAAAEVAAALGIASRTYEYFESGRGRINVDRVHRVGEVLNVDPHAILAAVEMNAPEFAVHCADNKLMTILLMSLSDFDARAGADIVQLDPRTLMAALERTFAELAAQARARAGAVEGWRGRPPDPGRP